MTCCRRFSLIIALVVNLLCLKKLFFASIVWVNCQKPIPISATPIPWSSYSNNSLPFLMQHLCFILNNKGSFNSSFTNWNTWTENSSGISLEHNSGKSSSVVPFRHATLLCPSPYTNVGNDNEAIIKFLNLDSSLSNNFKSTMFRII